MQWLVLRSPHRRKVLDLNVLASLSHSTSALQSPSLSHWKNAVNFTIINWQQSSIVSCYYI